MSNEKTSGAPHSGAQWWVVFQGHEFGPVSTDAIAQLCLTGIVRDDTPVRSTLFPHVVTARAVPALRTQINPAPADPASVEAALRSLPFKKVRQRWYQFYPLGPAASACAVGILLSVAAIAGFTRYMDTPLGAGSAARLGRTFGAATWSFLLPLLAGWLLAAVAWRVSRRSRVAALCAFWVGAAPLLCGAIAAPILERQRDAATRDAVRRRDADERAAFAADLRARLDGKAPAPRPAPPQGTSAADPESLRLNRIARWAVRESFDVHLRYDESIAALKLNDVWRPERLVDPATYPDARAGCDAARRELRELGEALERVHAEVSDRVRSSGVAPRAQEIFLADYAIHRSDLRAAYRTFAAEEKRILFDVESLLDFLAERTGAMSVRDGRLLFRDPADREEFAERARRLGAIAAERKQRVTAERERLRAHLDKQAAADSR